MVILPSQELEDAIAQGIIIADNPIAPDAVQACFIGFASWGR